MCTVMCGGMQRSGRRRRAARAARAGRRRRAARRAAATATEDQDSAASRVPYTVAAGSREPQRNRLGAESALADALG
jgi:hypothetical protein